MILRLLLFQRKSSESPSAQRYQTGGYIGAIFPLGSIIDHWRLYTTCTLPGTVMCQRPLAPAAAENDRWPQDKMTVFIGRSVTPHSSVLPLA